MAKGLKRTSELLAFGEFVVESGANTFTQAQITLPLNSLDREVFVVTDVIFQMRDPDVVGGTDTSIHVQVTKSSQTTLQQISNFDVIATKVLSIQDGAIGFEQRSAPQAQTTGTMLDYVAIVATENMFVALQGVANNGAKDASVRIIGYRAQADSGTYSALIASELGSA
tara:strand:+ start:91 stop:597 length:507 start_codon:yes stop_codon:yes gene_type:complete